MRLGISCRCLSALLALALPAQGSEQQLLIGGAPSQDVIKHYDKYDPTTAQDLFTLALAYFSSGQFRESINFANQAIGRLPETDKQQKALCFQLVSQAHGALGEYALAAKAATDGQRLDPDSKELASLRVGYYQKTGDKVNELIANDNLMLLDPLYGKQPKCEPLTTGIIVTGVVAVYVLYIIHSDKTDPEVKRILAEAFNNLTKTADNLSMIVAAANPAR